MQPLITMNAVKKHNNMWFQENKIYLIPVTRAMITY